MSLAHDKRSVDLHPEPLSEFAVVGESATDARDGGVDVDLLLDSIFLEWQRHGCIVCSSADVQPFGCVESSTPGMAPQQVVALFGQPGVGTPEGRRDTRVFSYLCPVGRRTREMEGYVGFKV